MNGSTIGIFGLLLVNIAIVSFSYGKIFQKVSDLCRRMGRVEDIVNGKKREGKVP